MGPETELILISYFGRYEVVDEVEKSRIHVEMGTA